MPTFAEWLQDLARSPTSTYIPSTPTSTDLHQRAQHLVGLARLTNQAIARTQQLERVRCIASGILQSPFVSQALFAQDKEMRVVALRTAYLKGAAQAHASATSRTNPM